MANTNNSKRPRRMAREPKAGTGASAESVRAQDVAVREEAADHAPSKGQSKIQEVLSLLKRAEGATLDELVQATGWLPHTTRAALTGLRKKGHAIERTKRDRISRYAVVEPGAQ